MKKINLILLAFVLSPSITFAATLVENNKSKDIVSFLNRIKDVGLGIVGILAVLFLAIGGLQYITSNGNTQKAEVAKKTLTYAITGLIFVILAQVIFGLINQDFSSRLFGPEKLTPDELTEEK